MSNLMIRDVPDELYKTISRLSPDERRRLEAQVIACLGNEVREREPRDRVSKADRARAFRESLGNEPLPLELVQEAIKGGRP